MTTSAGKNRLAVTGLIVLIVIAFTITVIRDSLDRDETEEPTALAWEVNVVGDNYRIDIIEVKDESLDEVSWSLLDPNSRQRHWDDPDNEMLRSEGDISNVVFNQTDFDNADITQYERFYSRDPSGTPPVSQNHTLIIIYMDKDINGLLSDGDSIWLRSVDNNGFADEGMIFRLVNERLEDPYGEQILPAV